MSKEEQIADQKLWDARSKVLAVGIIFVATTIGFIIAVAISLWIGWALTMSNLVSGFCFWLLLNFVAIAISRESISIILKSRSKTNFE